MFQPYLFVAIAMGVKMQFQYKPYIRKPNYYETDQMGIIHHSNYIRWFEEARIEFMDQIDFPYRKLEDMGIISPVLGVNCQYKSMVRFGDMVAIYVQLTEFNGVKYTISYEVKNAVTNELCATGTTNHCYLKKDGQPTTIKKGAPELYQKCMAMLMHN